MKKISLLLLLFAITLFSCEKDDISTEERGGDLSSAYSDSAGGAYGGSGSAHAGDSTLQSGQLTAGEWNDLDNWAFWQELIAVDTHQMYLFDWGFYDFTRISTKLEYPNGSPVIDAAVVLKDGDGNVLWRARSDNNGRAECFPGLYGNSSTANWIIEVQLDGETYRFDQVDAYPFGSNTFIVPGETASAPTQADVVFVFDATGSMGDELEYVKVEFEDIIGRIQAENSLVNFRLGATFYRDEGDEYVTRQQPLTNSFSQVGDFIKAQKADGGGDYPEAVHSALQDVVTNQQWAGTARTRLVFIVLDAPPHEQQNVISALHAQIKNSARKGIKIIPVSASGVNKKTEFLLRATAMVTNGTYTFITDHSGIGNDHLEPTIGEYEVEYLNDLIVRLIGENVE